MNGWRGGGEEELAIPTQKQKKNKGENEGFLHLVFLFGEEKKKTSGLPANNAAIAEAIKLKLKNGGDVDSCTVGEIKQTN